MTYTALSVLAVFCMLGCSTASPAHPEENFAVHPKRCSFGGCSDLIGGSIKTLSNTDGASAPPGSQGAADLTASLSRSNSGSISPLTDAAARPADVAPSADVVEVNRPLKSCSSASVDIDGNNSGAITILSANGGNHVRVGGNNSGAITLTASATRAEEQSVASSDDASSRSQQRKHHVQDSEPVGAETSQPRLKGCSFGSCTVIIDGNNSGAITVPADYDCTVAISGTNSGAITGARCVQRGVAVQAPSKESSSGPCSMNIQGDNSQAITLK